MLPAVPPSPQASWDPPLGFIGSDSLLSWSHHNLQELPFIFVKLSSKTSEASENVNTAKATKSHELRVDGLGLGML